ncbi:2-hydroxyacid dehydrogenase [Planosporangium thailandense]|uniref:2-hydroxyacid dehydrogenase n=1 Tax=Planosporangium thailandense TaxID=765197 RepID=A0ABX0Y4L0_9ACTN|nr:2-hydroxyacid dehydrogenase [Planosporangium thailandense]NJC72963.1 2-hydroxyacid dehydrogenase [Planosporangium thailandense]
MTHPVVLMPGPMTEHVMAACAARFDVIRLWEHSDQDETLRTRGATVTAIATAGSPPVDAALMDRLPNLRIVSGFGVGYDSIDAVEAARRGIIVTNTPDVLTDDVADVALGLLLMAVRELPQAERYLREGKWRSGPFRLAPATLRGRKLGIFGLGRIGEAIARRAEPFGVEVRYHNRRPKAVPYRYCATLAELADQVDTLVIATPGGPATRHLVDADVLRRLGGRGIVVNVARGSVIDQAALIDALRSGTILSAGLDVFENEPHVPGELLALPNAVLLPHVGSASVDTRRAMGQLVVDNLVSWFERGTALTPVPETPQPEPAHAPPGRG